MINCIKMMVLIKSRAIAKMLKLKWNEISILRCLFHEIHLYLVTLLWKFNASISEHFVCCFNCFSVFSISSVFMFVKIVWKCSAHALKNSPMATKKIAVDKWMRKYASIIIFWIQARHAQPMNESSLIGVLQSKIIICFSQIWIAFAEAKSSSIHSIWA